MWEFEELSTRDTVCRAIPKIVDTASPPLYLYKLKALQGQGSCPFSLLGSGYHDKTEVRAPRGDIVYCKCNS